MPTRVSMLPPVAQASPFAGRPLPDLTDLASLPRHRRPEPSQRRGVFALLCLLALALLAPFSVRADAPLGQLRPGTDYQIASATLQVGERAVPMSPQIARALAGEGDFSAANSALGELFKNDATLKALAPRGTLLVRLAAPVEVGTIGMAGARIWLPPVGAAADAAYDPATWQALKPPSGQGAWQTMALPVGTKVGSLVLDFSWRAGRQPELPRFDLWKPRLHNLTPGTVANAESYYTLRPDMGPPVSFPPNAVTRGGIWLNAGRDKDDKIPRAPITSDTPTWFSLTFDSPTPQVVQGLVLASNIRKFKLYAYRGKPGINPVIAPETDWKLMPFRGEANTGMPDRLRNTVVTVDPIATTAIRLVILETDDGPVARIASLHTLIALGDAAVPAPPAAPDAPPFAVNYTLPGDGIATSVINTPDGRRVANLFARTEKGAGAQSVNWDLRDVDGNWVKPGTYTLSGIWHPGLVKRYQVTPYPNIAEHAPQNAPWLTGQSGTGGWLADHTAPGAVVAAGDKVYFGSATAEGGVAMIETNLDGQKLWGHHNFMAWTGPQKLAANDSQIFVMAINGGTDHVWSVNRTTHETAEIFTASDSATRLRGIRSMAADNDNLYFGVVGNGRWLVNAFSASDVDPMACQPLYKEKNEKDRFAPDQRDDFRRMFRLSGDPSGQGGNSLTYINTTKGPESEQHIVLAMRRPVPIGSLVMPIPPDQQNLHVFISILKPKAAWPPNPEAEDDWIRLEIDKFKGWDCIPAPPGTMTRALRFTFRKGAKDDDGAAMMEALNGLDSGIGGGSSATVAWEGSLEGVKILRRRYKNVAGSATVRVNSGTVNRAGEWDAKRTAPLSPAAPGVYVLEWKEMQKVRGLAIKEIDGEETRIDVWKGPATGPVSLEGDENWEEVTTYKQKRRYYYQPDQERNLDALYMDGYADFGKEIETRAVRLRVISQWTVKGEGRDALYGVRSDRGGLELDPSRCRIYGIAALTWLDGEPPIDPLLTKRLEVFDLKTRKIVKELDTPALWDGLEIDAQGTLYGADGTNILKINKETGETTSLNLDVTYPRPFTIAPNGQFYVFDHTPDKWVVKVFNPDGTKVRDIGTPGGQKVGPWDPTRMGNVTDLSVDSLGRLWITENQYYPKRVTQWNADGSFRGEFFDRVIYGGGGVLDSGDPSKLYYGYLEFEIDWATGKTRLKGVTTPMNMPEAEQPMYVNGRKYLVSRDRFFYQGMGIVYIYDEATGTGKLAAAVGMADRFAPLNTPEIRSRLKGKAVGSQSFVWSDLNENGAVDPEEVQFEDANYRNVTNFDNKLGLGITRSNERFEVVKYLPSGVPVYERRKLPLPKDGQYFQLDDGGYFNFGDASAWDADGKRRWLYPTEGTGVHAFYSAKPLSSDQVVAEFSIAGHGTARKGDLGEWIATTSNAGIWHLWTADGLLAGQFFLDLRDPKARSWSFPEHDRGMEVKNVSAGQEHFFGSITQTVDDRFYGIWMSTNVFEIEGMDQFKRFSATVTVTPDDIKRAVEWSRDRQQRQVFSQPHLMVAAREKGIAIDANLEDWGGVPPTPLADEGSGSNTDFRMAWDDKMLYLAWDCNNLGPMLNSGEDAQALFKTGGAVDVQMQTDPAADPTRKGATKGDIRLLITRKQGKPIAVLYEATVPGTPDDQKVIFKTMVFATHFDRVRVLTNAKIGISDKRFGGYIVEAAIPLSELGLKPTDGLSMRLDWGILRTDDSGGLTMQRLYWSNPSTTIVSDIAAESELQPSLWGYVRYNEKRISALDKAMGDDPTGSLGEDKTDKTINSLLKDIDEELR